MISKCKYWRAITSVVLAEFAQAGGVHRQSSLLKNAPLHQCTQYALHATIHSLRLLALPSLHVGVRRSVRCSGLSCRGLSEEYSATARQQTPIVRRGISEQTGYYANNTQLPYFSKTTMPLSPPTNIINQDAPVSRVFGLLGCCCSAAALTLLAYCSHGCRCDVPQHLDLLSDAVAIMHNACSATARVTSIIC